MFAEFKAFQPSFVDTLVTLYLQIQTSLAGDDLARSKLGTAVFLSAMASAPEATAAQATVKSLNTAAVQLRGADDSKSAHTAFLSLSRELQALVEHSEHETHDHQSPRAVIVTASSESESDQFGFRPQ